MSDIDRLLTELEALNAASVTTTAELRTAIETPPPDPTLDIRVPAGGDLQAALDTVQAGQRILLEPAGSWTTTYTIRKKASAGRYWLMTEGAPDPTETRVTGVDAAGFAKIGGGSGPAFITEPGGGDLEISNVELRPSTDTGRFSTVMYLGTGAERDVLELPHDITLRRVYSVVDWTQQRQRRFVRAECAGFSLLD
ncbi:MAG TPA: hypothetical protein VFO31_30170, partial [Vicinamibacterales bacterium]|nr:hypothetical protein [Vicinamibacterales bacterium]